jgi:DNA-binding NarL/FixJ family response regulator
VRVKPLPPTRSALPRPRWGSSHATTSSPDAAIGGGTPARRKVETHDEVMRQEKQIVPTARDGLSDSEVDSRLLLSPRAVEWHLRKVFVKLEIGFGKELRTALGGSEYELDQAN